MFEGSPVITVGGVSQKLPATVEASFKDGFYHHSVSSLAELLTDYEKYSATVPVPSALVEWITKFKDVKVNLKVGVTIFNFDSVPPSMYPHIVSVPGVQIDLNKDMFQNDIKKIRQIWFYSLQPCAKFSLRIIESNPRLEDDLIAMGHCPVGTLMDFEVIPIGYDEGVPHLYVKSITPRKDYDLSREPLDADLITSRG